MNEPEKREDVLHGLKWCLVPYHAYLCEKCSYFEHGHYECVNHLMRDAYELLKNQGPKMVKRWNTKERSPYCPNVEECGRPLEEGQKYFIFCGQKIKWE